MFLFMGINCSPWHRWPWSHCPSPVGGGVSYSFWWSQSLFYCFLPFSISWSSSLCFGLFSTNTSSARELMSLCLPKEVHLYFLRHEIESQNLGLGKTLPWIVLVAVILLCFLQDRQYFKTNILCTLGRHPLVPLCFILPSPPYQSLTLHSCFSQFLWWHHCVHSSFMENELRFCRNVLGFVICFVGHTCCTALLFQIQPWKDFFAFKADPFPYPWPEELWQQLPGPGSGVSAHALKEKQDLSLLCLWALEESAASQQSHPN